MTGVWSMNSVQPITASYGRASSSSQMVRRFTCGPGRRFFFPEAELGFDPEECPEQALDAALQRESQVGDAALSELKKKTR